MTTATIATTVREYCDAYNCAIHKMRASSTMSAEAAVRRVGEKYAKAGGLTLKDVRLAGKPSCGVEVWEITLEAHK